MIGTVTRISATVDARLGFVSTRHCEIWTWLLNQLHLRATVQGYQNGQPWLGDLDKMGNHFGRSAHQRGGHADAAI